MPTAEGAISDLFSRPLFFALYDWFLEVCRFCLHFFLKSNEIGNFESFVFVCFTRLNVMWFYYSMDQYINSLSDQRHLLLYQMLLLLNIYFERMLFLMTRFELKYDIHVV